jgi:hypothetical protein
MRYANCAAARLTFLSAMLVAGSGFAAPGTSPTSGELLKEAVKAATEIADADERADTLVGIVLVQARAGDIAGAKRIAEEVGVPSKKNFAYGHIATALAQAGDMDGAKTMLQLVTDEPGKSNVYGSIVEGEARKGNLSAAKAAAVNVSDGFYKAHAIEQIALAEARAADFDGAKTLIASITGADDVTVGAYVNLAEIQAKAGKSAAGRQTMALALKAYKKVPDYMAPVVLAVIVGGEMKVGDLAAVKQLENSVTDPSGKMMIILAIARTQIEMGDISGAKATAARLTNTDDKIDIDDRLAAAAVTRGDLVEARELVTRASNLVGTIEPPPLRSIFIQEIGTLQAKVSDPATAAAWARSQKDPEVRAKALVGIVEALPNYHAHQFP